MIKVALFVWMIGLLSACIGAYESYMGNSARGFLLVGFGASVALVAAVLMTRE